MTARGKVALTFFLPGIACFVIARTPSIQNGPVNVILISIGVILVVWGFLRLRKLPAA